MKISKDHSGHADGSISGSRSIWGEESAAGARALEDKQLKDEFFMADIVNNDLFM
jgi:hypothetical protein